MTKRLADFLTASVLLLLTLPIVVVAAIGSALVLRAWPFFVQQRVGRDGTAFRFIKIRTLPTTTPTYLLKSDLCFDEVPRFTRMLRDLHLDELPQLFLVLTGRMSLVGPRPEMPEFHHRLPPTFAAARTTVRPGCTGLWQIGAACTGLIGDAPEYDRFYLYNANARLDLWILARTARMMLGFAGLVKLSDVPEWAVPDDRAPAVLAPRHEALVELADADLSA
ncbi:MAG: sugar transferase [Acidimicrobiales bacterium]|nr:sugar transferase [Acidimicrobiales bacterium]